MLTVALHSVWYMSQAHGAHCKMGRLCAFREDGEHRKGACCKKLFVIYQDMRSKCLTLKNKSENKL